MLTSNKQHLWHFPPLNKRMLHQKIQTNTWVYISQQQNNVTSNETDESFTSVTKDTSKDTESHLFVYISQLLTK